MVFTERQKAELKNIAKEIIKECLSDKTFLETIADIVMQKLTDRLAKTNEKVNALEEQICLIQGENEELKLKIDDIEQHTKLNQLRIFGVPETNQENLNDQLTDIFKNKLDINNCELESCYRIGSVKIGHKNSHRPIVVKFSNISQRNKIFYNKKQLKGTKISISEELTKSRYELLQMANEKFGKAHVWTTDGKIRANIDGRKCWIKNIGDLTRYSK